MIPNQPTLTTPVGSRYIKFTSTNSSSVKMTYRPPSGELLLKLPINITPIELENVKRLADIVISSIPDTCKFTLRGLPRLRDDNRVYGITLMDNDKAHDRFVFSTEYTN